MRNHEIIVAWLQVVISTLLCGAIVTMWVLAAKLASLVKWSFVPGLIGMFGKPFAIALIL